MNRIRTLAVVFLFFIVQASSFAQTTRPTVSTSLGFSGTFKPDAWTPIYVRISDARAPRPATIEVRTARGKLGNDLVARIATTRLPSTYTLYAPIGALDRVSLQLRDARGTLLRGLDLTDAAQQTPAALGGPAFGVAGNDAEAQRVVNQLFNDTGEYVAAGAVAVGLLPERAIGYSCIDCLVLPSLDADAIDDAVQAAIVAWVRSGGIVVAWPGSRSPTRAGPLIDALPATIAEPTAFTISGHDVVGRRLVARPGAAALSEASGRSAIQRKLGLGQVVMIAFDPTQLAGTSPDDRIASWRQFTSGQLAMSPAERRVGVFDPLVTQAVAEQQLKVAGPNRSSNAVTILGVAAMLGLLLGPAELILLAAAGRGPRSWYTLSGVLLTAVCGAGWIVVTNGASRATISTTSKPRIDVRIEAVDGLAAAASIGETPGQDGSPQWLAADRSDPTRQPAAELFLAQRESQFALEAKKTLDDSPARIRSIRFAGDVLHADHIEFDASNLRVANKSSTPWDAVAIVTRAGVRISRHAVDAGESISLAEAKIESSDIVATRRVETGIERLAAERGWEAILLDRRLAERLVRLSETEDVTIVAARAADGTSFTLQVVR